MPFQVACLLCSQRAGVEHDPTRHITHDIADPPDVPHLRDDYREVWLSGWRAGYLAHFHERIERPPMIETMIFGRSTFIDAVGGSGCKATVETQTHTPKG